MGIIIDGSSAAGNVNLGSNGTVTNLAVGGLPDGTIDNGCMADDAVAIADLAASGTASSSTFLRGDNSWAAAGNASWSTMTKVTLSGAASREFTGYPANTQMIMFGWDSMSHGASTGTDSSDWYARVGTGSTTYATSGYFMQAAYMGGGASLGGAGGGCAEETDEIEINRGGTQASKIHNGHLIFYHMGENYWTYTMQCKPQGESWHIQGWGSVKLGAALSAIKVYTHYQANDFDGGTMYTRYLTHD